MGLSGLNVNIQLLLSPCFQVSGQAARSTRDFVCSARNIQDLYARRNIVRYVSFFILSFLPLLRFFPLACSNLLAVSVPVLVPSYSPPPVPLSLSISSSSFMSDSSSLHSSAQVHDPRNDSRPNGIFSLPPTHSSDYLTPPIAAYSIRFHYIFSIKRPYTSPGHGNRWCMQHQPTSLTGRDLEHFRFGIGVVRVYINGALPHCLQVERPLNDYITLVSAR